MSRSWLTYLVSYTALLGRLLTHMHQRESTYLKLLYLTYTLAGLPQVGLKILKKHPT